MKKKYFGTDGIRGEVGTFPIINTFFFRLAISLAKSKKNIKKILIGKDTRLSCSSLENALLNGFKKRFYWGCINTNTIILHQLF